MIDLVQLVATTAFGCVPGQFPVEALGARSHVSLATAVGSTRSSPCVTCTHRETGFCAAVFRPPSPDPQGDSNWQHFVVANAGTQLLAQGNSSDRVFVLCAGWAFRYIQLPDGGRQILKFLLPGDIFTASSVFEERLHFSVKALTVVQVSGMRRVEVQSRLAANPAVVVALAKSCSVDTEASDKLIAVLGRHSAEGRIAHLFLHLMRQIDARNVIRDHRYPFPLRQQHIADTVGLTSVHVSRVISLFRERGILELSNGVLTVFNLLEVERLGLLS